MIPKPPMTFNQGAAVLLAIIFTAVLVHSNVTGESRHALEAGLGLCLYFLFGSTAGSQSKDKKQDETTGQLIDALKNSAPAKQ